MAKSKIYSTTEVLAKILDDTEATWYTNNNCIIIIGNPVLIGAMV